MTRKKDFDWRKWLLIGGIPAALGAVVLTAKTITTYAELPAEVKETKEDVADIKEYIRVQQRANDLMEQRIQQQQPQVYCEYDAQNILWCWDETSKTWYRGGQ